MSGEKMGLTDLILHSIEKKQDQAAGADEAKTAATPPAASDAGPAVAAATNSFPLDRYWQGNGMRPLANAVAGAGGPHAVPAVHSGAAASAPASCCRRI